jgi:tetratricopeptide (TPR) repeat protein
MSNTPESEASATQSSSQPPSELPPQPPAGLPSEPPAGPKNLTSPTTTAPSLPAEAASEPDASRTQPPQPSMTTRSGAAAANGDAVTEAEDAGRSTDRPRAASPAWLWPIVTAIALTVLGGGAARWFWSPEARVRRGLAAYERGDFKTAWTIAKSLSQSASDDPLVWQFVARVAERSSERDTALRAWSELRRLKPAQAGTWWLQQASAEMKAGRIVAAQAALQHCLQQEPSNAGALRLQTQLAGAVGDSRALQRALFTLLKQQPLTVDELVMLSATDPFTPDEQLLSMVKADPDASDVPLLSEIRLAWNRDDRAEAKRLLQRRLTQQPDDADAAGLLGELLLNESDQAFLDWSSQLPESTKTSSRVWLAMGKWLSRRGDAEPAIRCLYEALLREPEHPAINVQLGQALRMKFEPELAEQFAERGRLLGEAQNLSQRILEQRQWSWAGRLIEALDATGRTWEAWAWTVAAAEAQPRQTELAQQARQRQAALRDTDLQTVVSRLPGQQLDWTRAPLPDWSQYRASQTAAPDTTETTQLRFEDQAEQVGLRFVYRNSDDPSVPGRFIFESTGGGVGVLDFDQDGWPDVYFPQAGPWPVVAESAPRDQLFRNRHGQTYENVTASSGIDEWAFSQGLSCGDLDNDGFPDLYVANIGQNTIWRNNGDGTFENITAATGRSDRQWTVSCGMADFNLDGQLDLFDVNYLAGDAVFTTICVNDEDQPRVCRPTLFDPATDVLSLGQGDGRFQEVTDSVGLDLPHGMGLGVVIADFDGNRRPDLFISNDQTPNYLLLNQPDETRPEGMRFEEQGMLWGVALDKDGAAQACMGVAHADLNRDGRLDLFVTNFAKESNTLYMSQADGVYRDATIDFGLRAPSFALLGFGTQFFDADSDGDQDLVILNGHIDDFSSTGEPYRMRPQLFRGTANGPFVEVLGDSAGAVFRQPRLGRGLATLDWNGDGMTDLVASDLELPAALLTNRSTRGGGLVRLRLIGTRSQRDAVGAVVTAEVKPSQTQTWEISAGDGYEAVCEQDLLISTAIGENLRQVQVAWPSGAVENFGDLLTDSSWILIEGRGQPIAATR